LDFGFFEYYGDRRFFDGRKIFRPYIITVYEIDPEPSVPSYGVSKSGTPIGFVKIPVFILYGNGIITNTLSGMKIQ